MFRKYFSLTLLFLCTLGSSHAQQLLHRPNIEAAQRALQERYIRFVQAAHTMELPGSDTIPEYLVFPPRVTDGKKPGLYPEDCFYEKDIFDPESGQLNDQPIGDLVVDLASKMFTIDSYFEADGDTWGDYWVHPIWQSGLAGRDATNGKTAVVKSLADYYPPPSYVSINSGNLMEVFSTMVLVLEQMEVMRFQVSTDTSVSTLPSNKQGNDVGINDDANCAAVKTNAKADFNGATPQPISHPSGIAALGRQQSVYYDEDSQTLEQTWYAAITATEHSWTFDYSPLAGLSGSFEIYGRINATSNSTVDVESLLTADGAPHDTLNEWFAVDSFSFGSGGTYTSTLYADHASTNFVIGCPTSPGNGNRLELGWQMYAAAVVRPTLKYFPSRTLIACSDECGNCTGAAGTCSDLKVQSISYTMGLGKGADGYVGDLKIYTQTISALSASPFDLQLNVKGDRATVLRDGSYENVLKQIVTDQNLVDVEITDPYREYVIRYYDSDAKGSLVDGFYQPNTADAYKTVTVTNPASPQYAATATTDTSVNPYLLTSPGHGIAVGTLFQSFIDSTGPELPVFAVNGETKRGGIYTLYAFDANTLTMMWYDSFNGYWDFDYITDSDDSQTLSFQSPQPFGSLNVTEDTGTRVRTMQYASNTTSLTANHNITLNDDQDGKVRKHASVLVNDTSSPVISYASGNYYSRFAVTKSETDASDNVIRKTTTSYERFPWNAPTSPIRPKQAEIVSIVEDPDGEALTTTYDYYTDFANDGDNYGNLKSVEYPDGAWEAYEYDSDYNVNKVIRPWKDSALSFTEAGNHVTTITKTTLSDLDGDTEDETLRTTVEKIDGNEVARRFELIYTDTSTGLSREAMIEAATPGATWDAASNLRTDSWTFFDGDFNGEPAKIKRPDGTMAIYNYSVDAGTRAKTTTVKEGEPNGAEDDIVDGTQTVTVVAALGGQSSRVVSDIASGITLASAITPIGEFDELGRPLMTLYLDGTYETRSYQDCCGIDTVTDRTGLTRTTNSEMDGTVESVEANGITTAYAEGYDTDGGDGITGFTRTTTLDGRGTGDTHTTSVETYSPSGRMLARLDPRDGVNRLTTFDESLNGSNQWERTTTLPNTAVRTEVYHRDGELYESRFDGVARQRYDYGVESDTHDGVTFNARTETLIRLGESGETTEWVKTYRDMLGRVYKVETPDPNGSASTFAALTFYNGLGQRIREVDADGQQTLYKYNAEGELEESVLDVDLSGTIDYGGTDRITRTQTEVIDDATKGNVVRQTVSVWEADSVDQATVVQQTDTATDGLDVWSQTYGQETHISRVYNGSGSVTETLTRPDTTTETITTINGFQTSMIVQNPTEGTLSSITYTPDDFDRVYQETDNLRGTTWTYTYYDNGLLYQSLSPESDIGEGDAQTTTYTYDSMNRVLDVTLPDASVQSRRYHADGTLKMSFGSQTYPVEYTYDRQGRQRTMTTWQDFDETGEVGVSGSALTTWNYNPLGLLESKRDDDLKGTDYTYTAAGRQLSRTNARSITTTYGYHPGSRDLLTLNYSDSTPGVIYTYDRRGRAKSIDDASGSRILAYENGQLMDESYTSGALSGYQIDRRQDSFDRYDQLTLKSGLDSIYRVAYGYDSASRLGSVAHKGHAVTYGYTPSTELRQTLTFNNGSSDRMTVNLRYDQLNRLKSRESIMTGVETQSYSYQYNSLNQRERMTLEDNSYWQFGYDSLGQVESAVHKNASDTAFPGHAFGFTFDEIGNRTQTTTNGRSATYTSNNLNEYDERQVPRAIDIRGDANTSASITVNGITATRLDGYFHYALDQSSGGNSAQQVDILVTASLPDGGDNNAPRIADAEKSEYLSATPEVFDHDDDGNLTLDGKWTYTWDAENRLIEMETLPAAVTAGAEQLKLEFGYDSQSRRFSKKVYQWDGATYQLIKDSIFLYDGWNLIHETTDLQNGSIAEKSYVWGNDLSGSMQGAGGVGGLLMATHAQKAVFYPAMDGNGNVTAYYDGETGQNVAQYAYGPFGESIQASGKSKDTFDLRFSTKYHDLESGLYYFGYRFYAPQTGRWLNKDPIGEFGGLNLFGVIDNDPINYWDFLGLRGQPAVKENKRLMRAFQDASRLLDAIAKAMQSCSCYPKTMSALEKARKTVSGSLNLSQILEDIQKQSGDISSFSSIVGDSIENFAEINDLAAIVFETDSGNQEFILQRAKTINSSLKNVNLLLAQTNSVLSVADDQSVLNILAELSNAGSMLVKNNPASQVFEYYSSALKGISKGIKNFGITESLKNLESIAISCALGGEAETRNLVRLQNALNFSME